MDDLIYRGVILRQTDYGEAHRMLWIYTASDGIIKAVRYGIRVKKTSNAAAFQLFGYGDFRLRPSRGEIMTAVSADIIDGFYPVSEDIVKLSLMSYLSDITRAMVGEGDPDERILALFLNILYAAAYRSEPYLKLKAVYELKLMCAAGFRSLYPATSRQKRRICSRTGHENTCRVSAVSQESCAPGEPAAF